ncbi:hypothetical protein FLK61_40550 [Paenalkalicoccus suaedae]|uniref:Uncharacterized protein n=1 Tax=Paenalkalicoccus suaedae TaxID=2592382 RepID=A0A859FJ57_9BACI|nr:hypothetical protein [Paenalkalicoccus suaedae]QKS72892.1 hypothetical protein FLK61_40550 [Paenalkalicoccus suaedae]
MNMMAKVFLVICLIVAPFIMYALHLFPFVYSYENMNDSLLVEQGSRSWLFSEENTNELTRLMLASNIDSLRSTSLIWMSSASLMIGLLILRFPDKRVYQLLSFTTLAVVLIGLTILYWMQVTSLSDRIAEVMQGE